MNLIRPPSTELLQFLTGYVTLRCDLDLWPFDLGVMSRDATCEETKKDRNFHASNWKFAQKAPDHPPRCSPWNFGCGVESWK